MNSSKEFVKKKRKMNKTNKMYSLVLIDQTKDCYEMNIVT